MKHTESNIKIFFTRDYSVFENINGNRDLNLRKIERIKQDINEGLDVLKYCPVIVSEKGGKLRVIDGQHRLQVAKDLKSNVWYVIAQEMTLPEIAKMNNNTEKWKPKDFINCYAQQGNKHYKTLHQFIQDYGFPLSVCLQLLTKGGNVNDIGGDTKGEFQSGLFKVKSEAEAKRVGDIISRFKGFSGYTSRTFIVAICKIMGAGKVPIEDVIGAWEKNTEALKVQSSWKEYLVNLEILINIGKSKRRVIY